MGQEFGDPNENNAYKYISGYNPYTNIKKGVSYPNMLVTGGFHDSRVGYWQPAKFIAKMREYSDRNATDHLLLLRTYMHAGHFTATRHEQIEKLCYQFAFIMKTLGMV